MPVEASRASAGVASRPASSLPISIAPEPSANVRNRRRSPPPHRLIVILSGDLLARRAFGSSLARQPSRQAAASSIFLATQYNNPRWRQGGAAADRRSDQRGINESFRQHLGNHSFGRGGGFSSRVHRVRHALVPKPVRGRQTLIKGGGRRWSLCFRWNAGFTSCLVLPG